MEQELEVENQRPDEEIIIMVRQHPWVLARPIFYLIIIALIVFSSFLIWHFTTVSVIILLVAICVSLIYISNVWYSYANDLFVLTNQRLIKIDQKSFFNRRVSESELDSISNINYEIKGLVKSLLNFGDIKISTTGDEISIVILNNLENPHFIQERIMDFHKKYKSKD
jgi:uncharacterized membrane protein YdbT with pleckstrin-like domain